MKRLTLCFLVVVSFCASLGFAEDRDCRVIRETPGSTGTFVNGCYIADSIDTLLMALDIIRNNEQMALLQLQMEGKLRWIGKGTKVTRINGVASYNASKIRPRNETEMWICADINLVPCQ